MTRVRIHLRASNLLALALCGACTTLESASDVVVRPDAGKTGRAQQGDATTGVDSARLPEDADLANSDAEVCSDPTGFGGLGCYSCAPRDLASLENACSPVACTPFDDRLRLTELLADGGLPALPSSPTPVAVSAGANPTKPADSVGAACSELGARGTVVYVTGSSAAKPFLEQIGQQLSSAGIFMVYTSTGSCVGVDAIVNGTPMKRGGAAAPATFWGSPTDTGSPCDLPIAGVQADLGVSDVFAQTCPGFALANLDALGIRDAHGPVQTMTFAVPGSSRLSEISAQAAYFVYGLGSAGGVLDPLGAAPIWSDESFILQRSASSGTQALLAAAIGVPPDLWRGAKHATSDDLALALRRAASTQENADKAIGILASDYIDRNGLRDEIRLLAFRDSNQKCAVFPDSSATSRDKRNVRDGHYPLWGPLHLLHRVGDGGSPSNPAIGDILGYFTGTKALPNGVQLIDVYALSGLVPDCAMAVTRSSDGGNINPARPDHPCACLFEAKATGATRCLPCRVQGDCAPGETCSQGYCEG